jgi:hypothetical protein
MGKPFNPLLGETYELERPDFRILCEQVKAALSQDPIPRKTLQRYG